MGMFEDFKSMRNDLFSAFSDFIESQATIKDGVTNDYDPSLGQNVTTYSTNETLKVYMKDYSSQQIEGEILAGDVQIIVNIENLDIDIKSSATIEVNSKKYKVVGSVPVPKTNPVIFKCHCRGIGND